MAQHRSASQSTSRVTRPEALAEVRAAFAPVEAELWADANDMASKPGEHAAFVESAWGRVEGGWRA